jgi:molybdopterin-biosynthesis enzyme MoeA-like protein
MVTRAGGMTEGRKRMALLPAGCKTLTTEFWTPIAVVENVYILPGIPSMVRSMLTSNEEHFVGVPIFRSIVSAGLESFVFGRCSVGVTAYRSKR